MMKKYEILNKSEELCAAMSGDDIDYILYLYKGHLFRLDSNNHLTPADEDDRRYYERRNA